MNRRIQRGGSVVAAVLTTAGMLVVAPTAVHATTTWKVAAVTSSPDVDASRLNSVSCADPNWCMAVGNVMSHWDGSAWTTSTVPGGAGLNGVSCTSRAWCVAVGSGTTAPVIETWDGAAWTAVTAPTPFPYKNELHSVSCVSASFCVAVGDTRTQPITTPQDNLIETWDGTSWSAAAIANAADNVYAGTLNDVSCLTNAFCVAVGTANTIERSTVAEAYFFDGEGWTATPPVSPNSAVSLAGVACASTNACQAVGDDGSQIISEGWDGAAWTSHAAVTPGNGKTAPNQLQDITCFSATSCIAAGVETVTQGVEPLVETYNGSKWATVPTPTFPGYTALSGLWCESAALCVAAGLVGAPGVEPFVMTTYQAGLVPATSTATAKVSTSYVLSGQTDTVTATVTGTTGGSVSFFHSVDARTADALVCRSVPLVKVGTTYQASCPVVWPYVDANDGTFHYPHDNLATIFVDYTGTATSRPSRATTWFYIHRAAPDASGLLATVPAFKAYRTQLASGTTAATKAALYSGALPPGLSLTTAGVLSGTPSAPGSYSFTVVFTPGAPVLVQYQFVVTPLTVLPTASVVATVDVAFPSVHFASTGGKPTLVWSAASLPPNAKLTTTGVLSGAIAAPGTYVIPVSVTDAYKPTAQTASGSVTITVNPMTITPTSLHSCSAKTYCASTTFKTVGGKGPFHWSLVGGSLPPGIHLNAAGQLSGIPITPGAYSFTIQVSDSGSPQNVATETLSMFIGG